MSRLFVDRISPYQSGSVTVDGLNIDTGSLATTASFNAYTSSNDSKVNSLIASTGSFATTGSNTFNGTQTITANLNVQSGNINARDILMDDPGANSSFLMNPNFFTEFKGTAQQWQEGNKKSFINLIEESAEILLNGWDGAFTYDEALYLTVDGSGVSFKDWDGSYTPQTWLNIPQKLGNPSFKRTVEFEQVIQLTAQDPLPAGGVGQLAVSGSNLYFHNGSSWSQIN